MNIPTIETERLKLRAFTADDWESYAQMYSDASVVRYLSGKPLSKEQTWENLAIILGHWALLGYGIWALEKIDTGELVGRAGLSNLPGWPGIEVCWALGPKFWQKGYATEGARASINWAFTNTDIHRLISLIHPENKASVGVALRLGEQFCEQITFDGKPVNVYEIWINASLCGRSRRKQARYRHGDCLRRPSYAASNSNESCCGFGL